MSKEDFWDKVITAIFYIVCGVIFLTLMYLLISARIEQIKNGPTIPATERGGYNW